MDDFRAQDLEFLFIFLNCSAQIYNYIRVFLKFSASDFEIQSSSLSLSFAICLFPLEGFIYHSSVSSLSQALRHYLFIFYLFPSPFIVVIVCFVQCVCLFWFASSLYIRNLLTGMTPRRNYFRLGNCYSHISRF